MDPSVIAAMAKWPNVPDCVGWLSLDRRGQWRLQDKPVSHAGLAEFIGRNYERHDSGAWFMQNGPQRVWVTLEATPWIYRLGDGEALLTHTGQAVAEVRAAWLVDGEALAVATERGLGLVDDRDLPAFLERLRTATGLPPPDDWDGVLLELRWAGLRLPLQRCTLADLPRIGDYRLQAAATSAPA
ncbi:MAG: DUF2946 family protein [Rhodocyclales bacterium]|nr:DUF2946 family protein [Rhodocyclales bacterium]